MSNEDDIMSDDLADVEDQYSVDQDTEQDSDGSAQSSDTALSEMDEEAITGLQNDVMDESREDALDRIRRNWDINELTEMIAVDTWRKGTCPNDDSGWDTATIKLFRELSELTKTKRKRIKRRIAKLWKKRNQNHQNHSKAIGRSWDVKQRNMRQDLRELIVEYQPGAHDKSSGNDSEESEEEVQIAPKKKKVNKARANSKKDKHQNVDKNGDTNGNDSNDKEEGEHAISLIASSPSWPSDVSDGDGDDSLKKKLKRYWNLKEDSCRDAIPSAMRPAQKDVEGQWRGPIDKWGITPGFALRMICKFASKTKDQHAEVLKEFKKVLEEKVDGKTRGVAMPELLEVQNRFEKRGRRKVASGTVGNDPKDRSGEAENGGVDDSHMMEGTHTSQPQDQIGGLPSLNQRRPSALMEAGWRVVNATAALETAEGHLLQLRQQRGSALQTGHRATVAQANLEVSEAIATVARCKEQVASAIEKKGRVEYGLDKKDG